VGGEGEEIAGLDMASGLESLETDRLTGTVRQMAGLEHGRGWRIRTEDGADEWS
jgi:hypothetical protein